MVRMQFSLRMLFAAVAVVGIGAALWVAEPSWQVGAVEVLLLAGVPASAVMLSIYCPRRLKPFWIGVTAQSLLLVFFYSYFLQPGQFVNMQAVASVPGVMMPTFWDYLTTFLFRLSGYFRLALLFWTFAPVIGLLCVFTHWLLIRPPQPKA